LQKNLKKFEKTLDNHAIAWYNIDTGRGKTPLTEYAGQDARRRIAWN
jgi:hypothetical protein